MGFNFRFTTKPSTESYVASRVGEPLASCVSDKSSGAETPRPTEQRVASKPLISIVSKEQVAVVTASAVMLVIFSSNPSALPLGVVGEVAVILGASL